MTKFALIGGRISGNFGVPSILASLKDVLGRVFPDVKCIVFVPWSSYEEDLKYADVYGVEISPIGNYWYLLWMGVFKLIFGISNGPKKYRRIVEKLQDCDAAVEFNGIIFEESLGRNSFRKCLYRGLRFPLCRVLGIRIIKYTADIGPLKSRWNRFFGKFYMDKCMDMIIARSEVSRENARILGVKTPVRVLPDTAFILKQDRNARLAREIRDGLQGPIVGISISYQIYKRLKERYIQAMASFINEVLKKEGISAILIPNELCFETVDDEQVGKMIINSAVEEKCVFMKTGQLSAGEIKSVIAGCDVLVASRYHSVIAGLSTAVPTLVVGWHHKYAEVLRMFDMERFLIEAKEFSLELLQAKFEQIWRERRQIRSELKLRLPAIFQKVYSGADVVKILMQNKLPQT